MAGGCSRRLWRPAAASCASSPSMMLPVQARVCWRWNIPITVCSESTLNRSPNSPPRISSGRWPAAMPGSMTSDCHMDASVSATRRRLSPWARISRRIAGGRMPPLIAISRNSTYGPSASRTRSVGSGVGEPDASRTNSRSSIGTPVRSAVSAKVSPPSAAKRSNAGASRKSREIWPVRIAVPRPSSGMPASARPFTRVARRRTPVEKRPSSSGARIPRSQRWRSSSTLTPLRSAASARSNASIGRSVRAVGAKSSMWRTDAPAVTGS